MKYSEIFYFRYNLTENEKISIGRGCKDSAPRGGLTIAAILVGDKIKFGFANCSLNKEQVLKITKDKLDNEIYNYTWKCDNFNKKQGNELATTRALEFSKIEIPNVEYDIVKKFVNQIAEKFLIRQLVCKKLLNFDKLNVIVNDNKDIEWTWEK